MEDSRITVYTMGKVTGTIIYKDGKFSGEDEGGVMELAEWMRGYSSEEEGAKDFVRFLGYASPSYVTYQVTPL